MTDDLRYERTITRGGERLPVYSRHKNMGGGKKLAQTEQYSIISYIQLPAFKLSMFHIVVIKLLPPILGFILSFPNCGCMHRKGTTTKPVVH